MPRAPRPWFRFYVEACADRKLRRLKPSERWLWVAVLAIARQSPLGGFLMLSDREPFALEDIADFAGMSGRETAAGLALMERAGMLKWDDDIGAWFVPAFQRRQFESDDVTKRTAKHRSNEQRRNVPTSPVGTPPETEAESETDPVTSSSSVTPSTGDRMRLLSEAVSILTERVMERTASHGDRERHRAAVHAGKITDHRDRALALLSNSPTLTAEQLAEHLEPPDGPTTADLEAIRKRAVADEEATAVKIASIEQAERAAPPPRPEALSTLKRRPA